MESITLYGRDGIAVRREIDGRIIVINLNTSRQAEVRPDWEMHFTLEMLPEYWQPPVKSDT